MQHRLAGGWRPAFSCLGLSQWSAGEGRRQPSASCRRACAVHSGAALTSSCLPAVHSGVASASRPGHPPIRLSRRGRGDPRRAGWGPAPFPWQGRGQEGQWPRPSCTLLSWSLSSCGFLGAVGVRPWQLQDLEALNHRVRSGRTLGKQVSGWRAAQPEQAALGGHPTRRPCAATSQALAPHLPSHSCSFCPSCRHPRLPSLLPFYLHPFTHLPPPTTHPSPCPPTFLSIHIDPSICLSTYPSVH